MELRTGHKLTEVGAIPEEWECVSVAQLAARKANAIVGGPFGSDLVSTDYVPFGVPVIRGQNMSGRLVSGEFVFVSEEKAKNLKSNTAVPGDLVFTQRGTLGQVCRVPTSPFNTYVVSQSQMKLSADPEKYDPDFLLQFFHSQPGQQKVLDSAIQTGVPHTNLGILKSYKLPAPPLAEQRAIAAVLSDADALITSLDALIAKKHDLKQAAMQQLLTGRTRLPGFAGEWEVKRLGDMGKFLKGAGVRRDEAQSGNLPCVRYGEIYTVHQNVVRTFGSYISPSVAEAATRIQFRDLLFAGSGETKEEIGKCVALADNVEAYAGGDIVILRVSAGNPIFLGYLMNTPGVVRQKANRGQGDAVVHISAAALASIEIVLPDEVEQNAIAEVLTDMNAELTAIEGNRDKVRALKQGMMQELLTGKIRLV